MLLKIFQIIKANGALENLVNQEILYPINVAYRLHRQKEVLDNIESYVFNRINTVFNGEDISEAIKNENKAFIYDTIMDSDIEVETFGLSMDEIVYNNEVKTTINDINSLKLIFDEKNHPKTT